MNRHDVTEMIVAAKIEKGLSWVSVAEAVGASKEWVTAGCLGQMTFTAEQATVVGHLFDLPPMAVKLLQVVP
jgi:cyanate lyase